MPRETETPAVDWRAAAEETGRLAFEAGNHRPATNTRSPARVASENPDRKGSITMEKTPQLITPDATPAKQPTPVYRQSDASKIAYLLERSEPKEREFFYALVKEWEEGVYDLSAGAFVAGASALGLSWLDLETVTEEAETFRGLRMVILCNDWFADFLRRVLRAYDFKEPLTPDDLAEKLEGPLIAFQHEIRDARKVIRDYPETVADAMQKALKEKPELDEGRLPA